MEITALDAEKTALTEKLSATEGQLKEQSAKLEDQIYWSDMYRKNWEELTAQLKMQSKNLETTMQALQTQKQALQQLTQQLENNDDISKGMVKIVKDRVDTLCRFLDASVTDCQSKTQALLRSREAKRVKREKEAQRMRHEAERVLQLQSASQEESVKLWSLTANQIDDHIQQCQEQYQRLQSEVTGVVTKGFHDVLATADDRHQTWSKAFENVKEQERQRSKRAQEEQERLLERKRRLEELRKEAEQTEESTLKRIQDTTASVLQVICIGRQWRPCFMGGIVGDDEAMFERGNADNTQGDCREPSASEIYDGSVLRDSVRGERDNA